jgi:alkylation response protein AidB-like acyl-CoA dehydrogenase
MMATQPTTVKGGAWLLESAPVSDVFTPERMTDEHRLIAGTAAEFSEQEVIPALERLEAKDWELARSLLKRCGELGLLGLDVPEAFGGVELDKVSSLLVSDYMARSPSFGATFGAQANLCIMPILMFGTEEQKRRYLPGLVSGDIVGAYALSESGSGSDALGARARATRREDGSFVLSGEKMWITNGGFADVVIVFAKVDGEHFTAFIVERAFHGVSSGKEEHKMGLHGSSTTSIVLHDVIVPAANLLGAVGKGHKVAFNVLNFGRFKLGAMCAGGCKNAIGESAVYSASRRQFGEPIGSFGAIKHKIGEMTARTYALESMMYRIAGLIDGALDSAAGEKSHTLLAALEEFAIEASIAKVFGSEVLDFVLDENVQVHGGNGYVHDYPAERHYRDARVNRIFEGTSEINRLLIPGMLLKRAMKGDLPLVAAARALRDEIMGPAPLVTSAATDLPLAAESIAVDAFRKTCLLVAGAAMERYGSRLQDEQEVLLWLADLLIDTFAADCAVLRARSAASAGDRSAELQADAARLFVASAALRLDVTAREALGALAAGDVLRTHLAALRRVLKVPSVNTVELRRKLAEHTVDRGTYLFT